jgi:hypothetical protein
MNMGSHYWRTWQGEFPRGLGNYFEEAPKQRLGRGDVDVTIAVSAAEVETMSGLPLDVALAQLRSQNRRKSSAGGATSWHVMLAVPSAGVPPKARQWQTARAWCIELDETYETAQQANARALQLARWWCQQNSIPFDPDHSPYPVSKRISIVRVTIGMLLVALFVGCGLAAAGISFTSLPDAVKWVGVITGAFIGVAGSQLATELIERRRLRRIRIACQRTYRSELDIHNESA